MPLPDCITTGHDFRSSAKAVTLINKYIRDNDFKNFITFSAPLQKLKVKNEGFIDPMPPCDISAQMILYLTK